LGRGFAVRAEQAKIVGMTNPKRAELRIAVVDDNTDAAFSLAILLERHGFSVIARVTDATKALYVISRDRPSVAILDIAMPGIDGYELARRIRAEVDSPPKLIALTGLAQAIDKLDAAEAGFNAHLTKPVSWPKLELLLDSYCQHSPAVEAG
jgi:CheY-like chemotaxis protein